MNQNNKALFKIKALNLFASIYGGDINNLFLMNSSISRSGGVWYSMEHAWKAKLNDIPPEELIR